MLSNQSVTLARPLHIVSSRPRSVKFLILIGISVILLTEAYLLVSYLDPLLGVYSFFSIFLALCSFIFTYTKYKDPFRATGSDKGVGYKNKDHLVSIVIPAKNEPIMLREAVFSVLQSSYTNIEIVLVNDGSTDRTGEVMDSLRKENHGKIKVIHLPYNMGKRKATREGIVNGKIKGDIILFMDSDCVLDSYAIERILYAFDDSDVGAVAGLGRSYNSDNIIAKMQDTWYDGQFSVLKAMESSFNSVSCLPGILSAYRKEAILPCLDRWANDKFLGSEFKAGDDRHLTSYVIGGTKHYLGKSHRVWKTVYCESAIVYTEVPSKFKKLLLQQVRWKKDWFRISYFNFPFFYKDRNPFFAAMYYIQMVWSFLSPIVAIRLLAYLPLQGHYFDALVYVSGLSFVGLLFAADFKMRNPKSKNMWVCCVLWSLMDNILFSPLQYYSMITIKNSSWLTR